MDYRGRLGVYIGGVHCMYDRYILCGMVICRVCSDDGGKFM